MAKLYGFENLFFSLYYMHIFSKRKINFLNAWIGLFLYKSGYKQSRSWRNWKCKINPRNIFSQTLNINTSAFTSNYYDSTLLWNEIQRRFGTSSAVGFSLWCNRRLGVVTRMAVCEVSLFSVFALSRKVQGRPFFGRDSTEL